MRGAIGQRTSRKRSCRGGKRRDWHWVVRLALEDHAARVITMILWRAVQYTPLGVNDVLHGSGLSCLALCPTHRKRGMSIA